MQNLENIVEEIEKNEKIAETNLSDVDPKTRTVKKGHVVRAKEDLKRLYADYRKALLNHSAFILVTGSKAQLEKFKNLSENEFGCFTVDGESFYNEVLDEMPEQYFKRPVDAHFFGFFMAKFGDFALDLDIIGHPPLVFNSKYMSANTKGRKGALDVIKRAFNEQVGGEVIGLYTIDKVSKQAAEEKFKNKVCPVVIYSQDDKLIKELEKDFKYKLTPNTFVITVGNKVDKNVKDISLSKIKSATDKSVKESLLKVKENFKTI